MRRICTGYLVLLFVNGLDYLTGTEVSLAGFYLLSVAAMAWNLRPVALTIYVLAVVASWTLMNRLLGTHYSAAWILPWSVVNRSICMAITAISISTIKRTLDTERRLMRNLLKISLNANQLQELAPVCRICGQMHLDAQFEAKLTAYLRENTDAQTLGGVCQECLQARVARVAAIPVDAYFPGEEA